MDPGDDQTLRLGRGEPPAVSPTTHPETPFDADDLVGATLGGYRIVAELGRGGMGVVYLAEDPALRRRVALKVLPRGPGVDASARTRFRREAEAASRLDHPHLCGVHGVGEEAGVRWIAMRYVEGRTLEERLRSARAEAAAAPTTDSGGMRRVEAPVWRGALKLVETVARAAHAAHEAGVVHRDLKPQNVMVQDDGTPVVLDFGLAQDGSDDGLTKTGDVLGTPHYMAPEQVRGDARRADRRADVWALGVVLFETLTLRRPFDGATRQALWREIVDVDPPPLRTLVRGLPADLEAVVAVALAKDPDRRYATASALADDLRAVLETRPVAARPPSAFAKVAKLARRRPAAATLLAVLLLGGPPAAASWSTRRARDERLSQYAAERVDDARAALALRRTADASAALAAARALVATPPGAAELDVELARRLRLDALEAQALDADLDPDGRRALAALDAADAAGDGGLETAVLRALVLARTAGAEAAARSLAAFDAARPAAGAGPYARLAAAFASEEAASRASSRPATRRARLADETLAGDPDLAYFAAALLSARGDDRAALAAFEALLERAAARHWFAWGAAEAAARLHDHHAALAFAGRARALGGDGSPERLGRYSTHLRRAGRTSEAVAVAREAVRRGGETPPLLLHLANALDDAGVRAEVEPLLRRALALDPTFAEAHGALGTTLHQRGDFAGAAAAARASLAIREDGATRINLGNALIESGDPRGAEAELRRGLALRPDSAYGWNSLGTALMHQERWDDAEAAFARAVDVLPNYAQGLASLGVLLQRKGDSAGAERRLRAAFAGAPEDPAIRYRLACLVFPRDVAEAEDLLRGALVFAPDDADCLSKLAEVHIGRAEFAVAEKLMARSTALKPKALRAWLVYALAVSAQGRVEEGAKYVRRATELEPGNPALHVAVADSVGDFDPVEAYARLEAAARLDADLGEKLADRRRALRNRIVEAVDDPSEEPTAVERTMAADPVARAIAAGAGADAAARAAAQSAAESLPEGIPGSRERVLRDAALAALKE
jgi:tetratricopeptide (TPR) repeat protein/tRNA A-37 threonylcarbamoyl transferase component Bud32